MDCKLAEEKKLTLDEAIAHTEERINDTPCGRQHKQLADWLKELREMRNSSAGNAAAMREACQKMRDLLMFRGDGKVRCVLTWDEFNESQKMLRTAISKPARNCDLFGGDKENLHAKWFEWSRTKEGHNSDGTVKLTFGEWLLEEADKER